MKQQAKIYFLKEKGNEKRCLYASFRFIKYIEELSFKWKTSWKISITENNPVQKDAKSGYQTILMGYYENENQSQELKCLLEEVVACVQKEFPEIIIQVEID